MEPKKALPRAPLTHTRINAQGLLEIVDLHTGRVLCVQRSAADHYLDQKFENLLRIDTPEGPVFIERGIDPAKVVFGKRIPYSVSWGELLAVEIVGGSSLTKACQSLDLPYLLVCRWRREYPAFNEVLAQARKDRAESYHDKAIETAEKSTPQTVSQDKLRVETFKWAAEKGDSDTYGNTTKVTGRIDHAVSVVLDTGIRRRGDEGFVEIDMPNVKEVHEVGQSSQDGPPVDAVPEPTPEPPKDLSASPEQPNDV